MEILVAYDVATDTAAGRKRLRTVAKICEGFGQRVQKSVFECVVTEGEFERLLARLRPAIDPDQDSLRVYRLREPRSDYVWVLGRDLPFDIRDTLVV
jgi:CRISPR-associated protein Cas2